ncbi:hypothetical protein PQA65_gp11 [Yersinia phage vB_YenM_42.18]|uniref:Uncharacterized protein n=1 Tax=Yersinia phage vB_YenM_42.18 TaxID=2918926 RepID=A0AAE9FPP4_9CAUD|nr:hypothetical protein PQA65_gp11 [Yersinia phage vB_YenM_42.18]UNA05725.1 hypothetical protein vBYenM4218_011 [Yersinia phage vB_YenM_42.18]
MWLHHCFLRLIPTNNIIFSAKYLMHETVMIYPEQ